MQSILKRSLKLCFRADVSMKLCFLSTRSTFLYCTAGSSSAKCAICTLPISSVLNAPSREVYF